MKTNSDIDIFAIIFVCTILITIVIVIAGTFNIKATVAPSFEENEKTREAIEFCGCNDKACVVSYTKYFSREEYNRICKDIR